MFGLANIPPLMDNAAQAHSLPATTIFRLADLAAADGWRRRIRITLQEFNLRKPIPGSRSRKTACSKGISEFQPLG
jgi:hypothetical protein